MTLANIDCCVCHQKMVARHRAPVGGDRWRSANYLADVDQASVHGRQGVTPLTLWLRTWLLRKGNIWRSCSPHPPPQHPMTGRDAQFVAGETTRRRPICWTAFTPSVLLAFSLHAPVLRTRSMHAGRALSAHSQATCRPRLCPII